MPYATSIICWVLAWRSASIWERIVNSAIGAMAIMPTRTRNMISANLKLIRENNIGHSFDRWPQRHQASQNDVSKGLTVRVRWRYAPPHRFECEQPAEFSIREPHLP